VDFEFVCFKIVEDRVVFCGGSLQWILNLFAIEREARGHFLEVNCPSGI